MVKISFFSYAKFRETFTTKLAENVMRSWFPGHMYKGIKQMQAKLAVVDCFIEVHDARVPLSGRNPKFYTMLTAVKPHILVLNKSDLIDSSMKKKILECLPRENLQDVLFTDCKTDDKKIIKKIIPRVSELIQESENFNRAFASSYNVMIIGIPNVGKSSLINRLRNIHLNAKKGSAVGANPGMTRSVLEKIKVSQKPLVYLYDTPGVIQPKLENMEVGLKLALCKTLRDDLVGEELIADYLLYWLNKHRNTEYVKYLNLNEAVDDLRLIVLHIAKEQNFVKRILTTQGTYSQVPDILRSCSYFINGFRCGHYGKLMLDVDDLNKGP